VVFRPGYMATQNLLLLACGKACPIKQQVSPA
jgi:hypothetical protein